MNRKKIKRKFISRLIILCMVISLAVPGLAWAQPYVGEIRMFAGNFAPAGWYLCDGQLLGVVDNVPLFSLLGTTYGGDGRTTFALPDLRGRAPIHMGQGPGLSPRNLGSQGGSEAVTLTVSQIPSHQHISGSDSNPGNTAIPGPDLYPAQAVLERQEINMYKDTYNQEVTANKGNGHPHENMQSFLAINHIISCFGVYPAAGSGAPLDDDPFVGEIRMFAGNFPPGGWAFCNGQELPISQNTALFSLLGTTYGGDGRSTFALPNLQGRIPVQPGAGPGLTPRSLGETGGLDAVTLSEDELPNHSHQFSYGLNDQAGDSSVPGPDKFPAKVEAADRTEINMYTDTADTTLFAGGGGGQAHNNLQPYLTVNYIISLQGVFPPRP